MIYLQMAESVSEFKRWVATLSDECSVAIDDGGLTLVELDDSGVPTGVYYEVGGLPDPDE